VQDWLKEGDVVVEGVPVSVPVCVPETVWDNVKEALSEGEGEPVSDADVLVVALIDADGAADCEEVVVTDDVCVGDSDDVSVPELVSDNLGETEPDRLGLLPNEYDAEGDAVSDADELMVTDCDEELDRVFEAEGELVEVMLPLPVEVTVTVNDELGNTE
jgi:hypothetical protein